MSQSHNKHRRTPLTLGQGNPKHGNGRKASSDSTDSNKLSAPVVVIDKLSASEISQSTQKGEQLKHKSEGNVAPKEKAKENGNGHHKNGNSAKNGNGTEKAVAAVAPTQKDAGKEAAAIVKESKKEESEKKEDKKRDEKETPKKDEKAVKNGSDEVAVRESPRQKEIREKEELEKSKEQEQKDIAEAIAVFKAEEEVATLPAPAVTITPATPDVKSNESPTPKKRSTTANVTPVKNSPINTSASSSIVADPSVSLLQQSELYGFGPDVDEMEALRMDTDGFGDSPMPKSAKAVGKVLKFSQSPGPNRARVSPFRRVAETNASTFVNLSTVSEMSTEASNSPAVVVGAATVPGEQNYGSYRHISGRKSTKPLRELTLQNTMRESYRRIKTDLDDSISSVNATMGSEINNASFSTPMVAVKGRKRANIGGSEPDLTSVTESPKKARLDFSGFFGIMASPVTLLRNKFSRTSLLCSTPHGKKLNIDTVDTEEVEADQASGVVDVDMVVIDLTEEANKTDIEVDVASISNKMDDSLDVVPVDANEIVIETEQLKSVDDIKDKIAEEEARQDEAEAIAGTEAPKKGRCAVM